MILIDKQQQGGSIGKAGRLHVKPIDRSASLQFNPQVREVSNMGNKTMGSSYKANEKLYNGMLPSDQDFIRGLKENKMQEITEKYNNEGYEGSQENLRDLEEWRSYDSNLATKGKHYATRFTKNAGTVKSRKAEASLAMVDGNVLAEKPDGTYTVMSYNDLMSSDKDGNMVARPLRVSDAILLRQSDPSFNSFGDLGEFVDNVLMNTYAPADLQTTMKKVADAAGTVSIPVGADGKEISVKDLVDNISKSGGVSTYIQSNRDQMMSLANHFRGTMGAGADSYLENQAVEAIYNQLATGQLKLKEGETIADKIEDYKTNLITNYFYNSASEKIYGKRGRPDGTKGPGAQRKYEMNPMTEAQLTAGSQSVNLNVPVEGGKVENQEYMGTEIEHGRELFNSPAVYGIAQDEKDEGEKRGILNNRILSGTGGDVNFKSMAMADGTVLDETIGLNKVMVHPNSSFKLTFIPVKPNPSGKGGYVPAFEKVSNYHTVLKELHEMWANGQISKPEDIEVLLKARGLANKGDRTLKIMPVMAFDVVVKDSEDIDNRYLAKVPDDQTEDLFENATDDWMPDKKIQQTKAFMVVNNPSVYGISNYFGNDFIYKVDVNAASSLTSGLIESLTPIEEVVTKDETESFKEGGKAPTSDEIHNILFNN
jgi:hypothetical protein